jgi:hypothetical protein
MNGKMEIRDAIEALTEVPPQARDLYNNINAIWENNNQNRETLINEINNFIIHLNGTLKTHQEEVNNIEIEYNKTGTRKINNGGRKNRNNKRRFKYARC